jgi:hypothetical protein
MRIQIKKGKGLLFMDRIIAHSITSIEVGARNILHLLVHKSNFDVLKNMMDKEAQKEFRRKRMISLTMVRDKKNKKKEDTERKRRKMRTVIRQQKLKKKRERKKRK